MVHFPDFDPNSDEYEREVIENDIMPTDRTLARWVALQALYEIDTTRHLMEDVVAHHLDYSVEIRKVKSYMMRLVQGVWMHRERLDTVIREYATEWPLEQIAVVDRNILRIALFEFAIDQRTPISVAIDEAVTLARIFGAEGSVRFVNGVLGALANDIEVVRKRLTVSEDGVGE